MIKLKDLLGEGLFTSNLKMKSHEKLLVSGVIEFMRKKFGFKSKIIVKKKENSALLGDISLNDNSLNKDKFYLHFNPNMSYKMIIQSLIHELTHVKQVSKKELKPTNDYKHLLWKGKEIISVKDYKTMGKKDVSGYKKLPWEKEAYVNSKNLYKPFINSTEWKSLKGKDDTLDFIVKEI